MSVDLNINGQTYFYPETGDVQWGPDATDWAVAVTTGMLQKAGGLFILLDEVDFGPNHGLKSLYYKSRTDDVASHGSLRLANTDVVSWRNATNDGDLDLGVNGSNELVYNNGIVTAPIQTQITVQDTNSIDLDLTSSILTSNLKLSSASPSVGSVKVDLSIQSDGLLGELDISDVVSAIPLADGTTTGLLSSTDWNTFNNKQTSGSYITALTGDVTASGPGSAATTIGANKVTNGMLAQMPTLTLKGNNTGSTADPLNLTVAQVNAILPTFTDTLNGLAPLSGGGTSKFLRADGSWSLPPGIAYTFSNTNSINLASDISSNVTANLNLSSALPDAGFINVTSSIETDGLQIQVPIADTSTTGVISSTDWNTFNNKQNALTLPLTIANGGTGQTTQQAAINALTGAQSAGKFLRSDGTNSTLASIQAADVPTLNQNTTGTASNVTGVVLPDHGGTGVANNAASTLTISGNFGTTLTVSNTTSLTLPTSGTLATLSGTETLSHKTLESDSLHLVPAAFPTTGLSFSISGTTSTSTVIGVAQTANRAISLPDATTTLVGTDATQTLTNKILTGNTAVNLISGSGTLILNTSGTVTLPNATDTLVGKATTDTLTNKTLSGNTATNLVSGSGTFTFNTSGTITAPNATDTLVGKATTDTLTNKTFDTNTNTLKSTGASANTFLKSDGSGNTSWASANANLVVTPKTGNYTLSTSDDLITADSSGGTFTLTLPTAVGNSGKIFRLKKTDSSTTAISIATTSSQTIDGSTTRKLNTQYEEWEIVSDGSNWLVLNHKTITAWTTAWTFTQGAGFGTVLNKDVRARRVGDSMEVQLFFNSGTVAGTVASIGLPFTIDSAKLQASKNKRLGGGSVLNSGTGVNIGSGGWVTDIFYDGTDTTNLYATQTFTSANYVKMAASSLMTTGAALTVSFTVPISGWDE